MIFALYYVEIDFCRRTNQPRSTEFDGAYYGIYDYYAPHIYVNQC